MALLPKSTVWDKATSRSGVFDDIGERTFNLIFALTTMYGMAIYGVFIALFLHTKLNFWEGLGLFLVSMAGCFVSASDFAGFKIVGLTMIAGGLGAITGPYVNLFKLASVTEIAGATVLITVVLGAIGWIYPKSFASWGLSLFVLLIGAIVLQIFAPIIYVALGLPLTGMLHALDWLVIVLFSAYLIYDFNRARDLPKTIDNAMDCGVSVFLDVANIFIRLLSLFGVVKDD
jgi:FtsH-binding integral membrane protein